MTKNLNDLVDGKGDLTSRAEAFYLYIKGYHFEVIATALGVSSRTIRTWSKDDDWKKSRDQVKALLQTIVLAEVVLDVREFVRPFQSFEEDPEKFRKKVEDFFS